MGVNLPLAQFRPRDQVFYVNRNRTVLATARDGFLHGQGEEGLFVSQTRLLCVYRYRVNGRAPEPVGISNLEQNTQIAYYVFESPTADNDLFRGALGPGGRAATEAIELRLLRFAGDGLAEEVELRNHTLRTAPLTLELEIDADFADANEVHDKRAERGRIEQQWRPEANPPELEWTHTAEHDYDHQGNRGHAALRRSVKLALFDLKAAPAYDAARKCLRFEIELPPHASWRCRVLVSANIDGHEYRPIPPGHGLASDAVYNDRHRRFLAQATQVEIGTPELAFFVHRALTQAKNDLLALRLYDLDREDGGGGWTLAAGLPVYIALFGRDTLTAAWQSALLSDQLMRGTLPELAATQATERNDWRDAQPGRFVHQMETGPLATLMYNPNGRYYGGLTGPGFYPVVLSNLWHWTGDRDLVRRFVDPAMKGLAFLDRYARNESGFYAYQKRSDQGVKNQAWKDSYDAIVYPDGRQVKDPIAPTEFQAFVFASKVRMSELMWCLDERDLSRKLFDEAIELRDRFNECFWMEDEGCFGMGLDPSGQLIRSVGSETLHAVAAGAIRRDRAERGVERLFKPDMFSGWGVRTLSSLHPAF